ncbi:hypothetical protein T12_512 [Trichinella patagoniensis]|uniref:Uncharacterized protein n=1 Tax=Trichinella patagoniensis TaxID=990121 RepID=A0A0V0ZAZ0_9BILA|nr:hypothetical protein T12_512 [Trichinella patagoniensis]
MLFRLLLNENWLRSIPSEVRRWRAINFQLIRSKTEIIDKILHLAHTVVRIDSKSLDGSKTWNDKKLTVNRKNGLLTTNLFNKTLQQFSSPSNERTTKNLATPKGKSNCPECLEKFRSSPTSCAENLNKIQNININNNNNSSSSSSNSNNNKNKQPRI